MSPTGLVRYDHTDGPRLVGTMWTLHRDRRTLTCELHTHPLGWELRARATGDDLPRTPVVKDQDTVLDTAAEWREAAQSAGWTV